MTGQSSTGTNCVRCERPVHRTIKCGHQPCSAACRRAGWRCPSRKTATAKGRRTREARRPCGSGAGDTGMQCMLEGHQVTCQLGRKASSEIRRRLGSDGDAATVAIFGRRLVFERKIKGYPSRFRWGSNGAPCPRPAHQRPYWVPPWKSTNWKRGTRPFSG